MLERAVSRVLFNCLINCYHNAAMLLLCSHMDNLCAKSMHYA